MRTTAQTRDWHTHGRDPNALKKYPDRHLVWRFVIRRYLVLYRAVAVIGLPVLPGVAGSCQSGASTGSDEQLWDPGSAEEATEAGGAAGAAGATGAVGTAGATRATGAAGEAGASCFGTRCGSHCVDLSTDVDHYGVCGRTCSAAGASKVVCEGGGVQAHLQERCSGPRDSVRASRRRRVRNRRAD
ncbi:hypothetical protein ACFL5O_09035 [Myxococcota bacterium]